MSGAVPLIPLYAFMVRTDNCYNSCIKGILEQLIDSQETGKFILLFGI